MDEGVEADHRVERGRWQVESGGVGADERTGGHEAACPLDLYVADVETRRVRAILTSEKSDDMISGIWGGVDWSPDSRFIYFLRQNQGALWRIAAAGGAPTLVGELAKQPVRTIDVSRDGRHVIFATDQRSDTVEVWTLENVLQAGRRPSP